MPFWQVQMHYRNIAIPMAFGIFEKFIQVFLKIEKYQY